MALAEREAADPADPPPARASLYETDIHAWAMEQAALIRRLAPEGLDVENLAEEIEALGGRERREIESRLEVLLVHLLKFKIQPYRRKGGREATIKVQRRALKKRLAENPSLRSLPSDALAEAYQTARLQAVIETGLPEVDVPLGCPFALEQVMDDDFFGD
jgi:hypothetical protein